MPAINSRRKYEKLAVVAYVPQNTQNLVISRCSFAEDGCEMYREDLQRTCTAVVFGDFLVAVAVVVFLSKSHSSLT